MTSRSNTNIDQLSVSTFRDPSIYDKVFHHFLYMYFLQGLPLGFQNRFLPIYFRKRGMSLVSLWMLKLLTITWVLKPFIAIYIMENSNIKRFLLRASYVVLCVIFLIASQMPLTHYLDFIGIMFLVNLTTSLQDVAMDSILNEIITSTQMINANFAQTICGKIGSMFSGITFSLLADDLGLDYLFYAVAALYLAGLFVAMNIVESPRQSRMNSLWINDDDDLDLEPQPMTSGPSRSAFHHSLPCGFLQIMNVDGTIWGLVYLLIYKIGEFGTTYTLPMFLIDMGYAPSSIGLLTTVIGELFGITGSMAGEFLHSQPAFKVVRMLLFLRTFVVGAVWFLVVTWDNSSSFYVINSQMLLTLIYLIGGGVSSCSLSIVRTLLKKSQRKCRSFHCSFLITVEFIGRIVFSSLIALITELMGYHFIFAMFTLVSLLAYLWTIKAPAWIQNSA